MRSGPAGRTPPDNDLLPMMEPLAAAQSFGSLANLPVGDIGGAPRGIRRDALHGQGENEMRRAFNIIEVRQCKILLEVAAATCHRIGAQLK